MHDGRFFFTGEVDALKDAAELTHGREDGQVARILVATLAKSQKGLAADRSDSKSGESFTDRRLVIDIQKFPTEGEVRPEAFGIR